MKILLSTIAAIADRVVKPVDLTASLRELGYVGVPPCVTEPVELVAKGVKQRRVPPVATLKIPLFDPLWDRALVKRLPLRLPVAVDDPSPLWNPWSDFEKASANTRGVDG